MKKRENFYRRDPGLALQGMSSMSLEERGVYNTVIDLLYLTWRPLEDDRGYIAGHCRCAVQKLNPILNRLIASGKLITFVEDGRTYLSNPKFEDERTAVKGTAATRSGRGKVEEKSAGVGEKSASVSENGTLLGGDVEGNQPLKPIDRVDKSREEEPPKSPKGDGALELVSEKPSADEAKLAFDLWNVMAKANGLPLAKLLDNGRRRAINKRLEEGGLDAWAKAVDAVSRSKHCRGENDRGWRADIDFVCQPKSWRRLLEGSYGQDAQPLTAVEPARMDPATVWKRRIEEYRKNAYWNRLEWGPAPGKPGCTLPAEILMANGYMPAPAEGRAA